MFTQLKKVLIEFNFSNIKLIVICLYLPAGSTSGTCANEWHFYVIEYHVNGVSVPSYLFSLVRAQKMFILIPFEIDITKFFYNRSFKMGKQQ